MWHFYTAQVGQRRQTQVNAVFPVRHPSSPLQGWQFQPALKIHKASTSTSSHPQHAAASQPTRTQPGAHGGVKSAGMELLRCRLQDTIPRETTFSVSSNKTSWYSALIQQHFTELAIANITLLSTQLKSELQQLILPTPTSNTVSYAPSFKSHLNVSHTFAAWTSQKISKRRASVCSLTHAKGVNNTIKDYNLEKFLF